MRRCRFFFSKWSVYLGTGGRLFRSGRILAIEDRTLRANVLDKGGDMRKVRLLVAASLIAGATLVMGPAQPASACAPDPDGVNPCQSCYDYQALVYKLTHRVLYECPE